MRTLICGCVVEDIWPVLCPEARKLQAQLAQAIGEKDRVGARTVRARLAVHRDELASPDELEEITRPGGALYVAERPAARLTKAAP
jgi:hypothetical protein